MYGDERKGDNLYTNCIVALDVTTGKLKWFYQMTPHDTHDWDAISDPVLLDLTVKGQRVKAVVQANRNGFYYALDRVTGKLLAWKAYTKVSWADGIGDDGRPKEIAGHEPTETGNKACPGIGGGHNWQASTYSPQTGMYYFGAGEGCQIFFKTKQDYTDGMRFEGSTAQTIPQEPVTGAVLGIDPATGATRWRFPTTSSPSGGLLSTAGGLVFAGDRDGYVFALDAGSGNLLWQFQTGGAILAPPITYLFQGKQYVTISGGSALITFAIP
jgi:alcohol dehydrogenase (cytochrome c)